MARGCPANATRRVRVIANGEVIAVKSRPEGDFPGLILWRILRMAEDALGKTTLWEEIKS